MPMCRLCCSGAARLEQTPEPPVPLFEFQKMLKCLHDEHFVIFPCLAKIHKLREDCFRLLRINGRATCLAK